MADKNCSTCYWKSKKQLSNPDYNPDYIICDLKMEYNNTTHSCADYKPNKAVKG